MVTSLVWAAEVQGVCGTKDAEYEAAREEEKIQTTEKFCDVEKEDLHVTR